MLNNRTIEAFIMFKKKKVCESSIYDLWIFPAEFYKLKPLFAAVTSSPEGCSVLVFPRWASVCLDWHHIQADSAPERSGLIVKPTGNFLKCSYSKEFTVPRGREQRWRQVMSTPPCVTSRVSVICSNRNRSWMLSSQACGMTASFNNMACGNNTMEKNR